METSPGGASAVFPPLSSTLEESGPENVTGGESILPPTSCPPVLPPHGSFPSSGQASSHSSSTTLPHRCVLEDFTRCSESHLWKLMMSFYDRKGVESWSQGIVPHFITCNAFIGRAYAQVFQGYLRDCAKKARENGPVCSALDPSEPLYIIELGAGSGKFSFFMLKALEEMRELLDFPFEKIVYVMTDFTKNHFNFWETHPGLHKYIAQGSLDLAIFDAVHDSVIRLSHAGTVLAPGSVKNPMCLIANYLFDTLCHDVFQVDGGVLKEGLISVGSKQAQEPDPLDPEIIKRFHNLFQYQPVTPDYYAHTHQPAHRPGHAPMGSPPSSSEPLSAGTNGSSDREDSLHLGRILHWYRDYFGRSSTGGSFLFPIGALRALRRLLAFSNDRGLVISGDKGSNQAEQFRGLVDPHIAVHGSFSVMVNYHAIGLYFISRGGFALHNPQEDASLKVSAFVLSGRAGPPESPSEDSPPEAHSPVTTTTSCLDTSPSSWAGPNAESEGEKRVRAFPCLRAAFSTAVDQFGPNDFFVLQKSMKEDSPNPTLKAIVALLKLGDWDPDVFYKFRETILNQVPTAGQKLRNDLCRGVPRVWEHHYMLDRDKDIAFEIGRFYYGIREYERALGFYSLSSTSIGEHHVTCHNMGLCHYSLGRLQQALEHFERSLALNASYEKAWSWQQKVLQELNPSPSPSPGPVVHETRCLDFPEVGNLSLAARGGGDRRP